MSEAPITRATMLLRLRDAADADAWSGFVQDYGPMLYRFARSRGLQDADAADVVQDVLRSVNGAIGRLEYDKEKGGFRAWLFTITRNKLSTYFGKQHRLNRDGQTGTDSGQQKMLDLAVDDRDDLEQTWDLEYQRTLMARAVKTIRPQTEAKTWAAFELTAINELSAAAAGKKLNMKTGTVYVARSRVTARLRAEIERLLAEDDFEVRPS